MIFNLVLAAVSALILVVLIGHLLWTIRSDSLPFSRIYHISGILIFSGLVIRHLDAAEIVSIERAELVEPALVAAGGGLMLVYHFWAGRFLGHDRRDRPGVFWAFQICLIIYVLAVVSQISLRLGFW